MQSEIDSVATTSTTVCCDPQRPPSWPDPSLLARMLAREERAWREFVRRFERVMKASIQSVTRRFGSLLGSADRDDIYAGLLLALQTDDMHRLRAFSAERGVRLSTWLSVLARNATWDFLRVRVRSSALTGWSESVEELPSAEADALRALDAKETLRRVQAAVPALSPCDQTFVRLYYVEGMEPLQVSRAMRISVKTVYSKHHKLRSRLSASIAELRPASATSLRKTTCAIHRIPAMPG